MVSTRGEIELEAIESKIEEIFNSNIKIFHEPQLESTNSIKQLSQKSYNVAVSDEFFRGRSLSKLLIDGFDEEQIWQQSDLLNKAALSSISDCICNLNTENILSILSATLSKSPSNKKCSKSVLDNESVDKNATIFNDESSAEEEYAFDDDSDSDAEFITKLQKDQLPDRKSEYVSDVDDDSNMSTEFDANQEKQLSHKDGYVSDIEDEMDSTAFGKNSKKKQLPKKQSNYASIVDDKFFKLSKLENFLKIEDLKEERGEDSASDDDIDLFQNIPSDDVDVTDEESQDEQNKIRKSARDLMYEDFFDDPESEVEDENSNVLSNKDDSLIEENEKYSFDESESDAEMEIDRKEENQLNHMDENSLNDAGDKKSKFQLEQDKVQKKIQECEKSMLQPLPWHLTGEVAADKRPVDSLLNQEADFDCNTKQDLLVDKDLTEKIEEITIMAIRNKAFFDVERKYKPTEDIINYKKEVVLEQTKSKKSLAEVYEEDYLKKQTKQVADDEENPKHKEIKKLLDSLLPQLHALFSHIPKPAVPEIKVVSNLPAITVEEVAPTNVSDATLLAPEEVKKKTGLIKGKTERTDTDRKHERRKKKIHQRLKGKKMLQKLEQLKENPSTKMSKLEKMQILKKLEQHKNTKISTIDKNGKVKSSKDFFSRLQDTMDTKNKTRISGKKVKNK